MTAMLLPRRWWVISEESFGVSYDANELTAEHEWWDRLEADEEGWLIEEDGEDEVLIF